MGRVRFASEKPGVLETNQNLPQLYRFCFLMTGEAGKAREAFQATLREAALRSAQGEAPADRLWFFRDARWRCLAAAEEGLQAEHGALEESDVSPNAAAQIAQLHPEQLAIWISAAPEPQRSALAAYYLDEFTPREMLTLLDLKPGELSEAIGERAAPISGLARCDHAAPRRMSIFRISRREKALVRCAPITEKPGIDRRMRVAVLRARRNKALAAEFNQQQAFDKAMAALVQETPVSAEIAEWFRNEKLIPQRKRRTWRKTVRNPAVLSIALALAVIAGVIVFIVMERVKEFPGSSTARKMLGDRRLDSQQRARCGGGRCGRVRRFIFYEVPARALRCAAGIRPASDPGLPRLR